MYVGLLLRSILKIRAALSGLGYPVYSPTYKASSGSDTIASDPDYIPIVTTFSTFF